jgi:hypothetical protein
MSIKNIWFEKPGLMIIFITSWAVLIGSLLILKDLPSTLYDQSENFRDKRSY